MKPGQGTTYITAMITDLFASPGVLETVALALRDMESTGLLQDGFNLDELVGVHSVPRLYGSTAGPFPGIGGAAMTWFQLTVVYSEDIMVLFANDRFYGVAPFDPMALMHPDPEDFAHLPVGRPRMASK